MRGTYTFRQNGEVIAVHENLITTAGRKAILEYLAGYQTVLAGTLMVGVGATAANVADKALAFEVDRQAVFATSVDYATNAVIFRAQLPSPLEMVIYEAGASSASQDSTAYGSQMIMDFDQEDLWSSGTWVATNSRLGQALQVSAAVSATTDSTLSDLALDLSGYSDLDQFKLAFRSNTAFTSSVSVIFKTDAANYYTLTSATPANGVYNTVSFNKSAAVATGTPNWANITQITVRVVATAGGATSVDFDALRIEDVDANREENVLISRSVLGAPVVKALGSPLDIEYAITI